MPRKVGEKIAYKDLYISTEFKTLGFKLEASEKGISLIIPRINKQHGGVYYCEKSNLNEVTLSSGTFLTVEGKYIINKL